MQRAAADTRNRFENIEPGKSFANLENDSQILSVAACNLPLIGPVFAASLFGAPSACPCGAPTEAVLVRVVSDLVFRCTNKNCVRHLWPLLNVETKPGATVGEWSVTTPQELAVLLDMGVLQTTERWSAPRPECFTGECGPHEIQYHRNDRFATPQVARAALLGAPGGKLTPVSIFARAYRGDATKIYTSRRAGLVVNEDFVTVRDIDTSLDEVAKALLPLHQQLGYADKAMIGVALAAWWSCLRWSQVRAHMNGPLGQLLPDWAPAAALKGMGHVLSGKQAPQRGRIR